MAGADFNRIASNIAGLNALNALNTVNNKMATHQMRLATGKRINEAADDPAGLTIATKFRARSEGLGQALSNIGDAKNLMSVAEGGLQKINDILVQMKTKATQAASDTLGSSERAAIQSQLKDWTAEIDNIVNTTTWNGNKLLDGLTAFTSGITFQVGDDTTADNRITLTNTNFGSVLTSQLGIGSGSASVAEVEDTGDWATLSAVATAGLQEIAAGNYTLRLEIGEVDGSAADSYIQILDSQGNPLTVDADGTSGGLVDNKVAFTYDDGAASTINFGNGLQVEVALGQTTGVKADVTLTYSCGGTYNGDVSTAEGARNAVDALNSAINDVSERLQTVGTVVSRLTFREETVTIARTNVEAAYNRIMNADMASEQLESTKAQILQQTAIAMLSQANTAPQSVLSLFR
jgi:flagellin